MRDPNEKRAAHEASEVRRTACEVSDALDPIQLAEIIKSRQTLKILGDPQQPIQFSDHDLQTGEAIVNAAIEAAGWAPFHYDRGIDGIAEPWRVHRLSAATCRKLAIGLPQWCNLKPGNKLPAMLAACGCLIIVNWIPQFRTASSVDEELTKEKQQEIDDEHLAATAAFVQNLLLMLTASGLGTYWSSGGPLGSPAVFQRLGLDANQKLLAAVFVEFGNGEGPILDRLPGKNRELRSPSSAWSHQRLLNTN